MVARFLSTTRRFGSELYTRGLRRCLTVGLRLNAFDYPPTVWPPPTPARQYIREFLETYRTQIKGRCVEFPPPVYREEFGRGPAVTSYDVWGIEPGQGITVVGDLQSPPHIKDGAFDTILCTHVLCCVARPWLAAAEMHRLLAPGGVALCTAPVILQRYAPDPKDYWRFTKDSLQLLFSDFSRVEAHSYGNAITVAASPFYLMTQHLPRKVLRLHDDNCPNVVAAAAWK